MAPNNVRDKVEEGREKLSDFERRADPNNSEHQKLLEEMRAQLKTLEELRKLEDPRLTFTTPEFKEAQRIFTENLKKNFGRPVEWAMIKKYPWSNPVLQRVNLPDEENSDKEQ